MKSLKNKKIELVLKSLYYHGREILFGQFMETYLHRPIKILQFLTPRRKNV